MRRDPEQAPRPCDDRRDHCLALRDFLPWGYLTLDESSRIQEINPAAAKLLDASPDDLTGTPLRAHLADDHVGVLLDALAQTRTTGNAAETGLQLVARDGRVRHVELRAQWFDGDARPIYRIALLDVTESRRARLALRQVADEMRDLYQNAPCGYHSVDPEGVVIQINDTELRWLGYAREEVVRKVKLTDLMPPHSRSAFERAFAKLKAHGRVQDVQIEMQRKDGSVFPVLLSATAVTDSTGRFLESRASMFDITRRKLAEDEASRYAQQLKAMSRRVVEVQETERRRLAQELHDRVGQSLTALHLDLNIIKVQLQPDPASVVGVRLDDSLKLVDATLDSIRDVMAELRPAVLDDYGLAAVLRWYTEEFSRRTGLATSVIGSDPMPRLAPDVEGTLFRIVQEALTNVAKHAGAREVRVTLRAHTGGFSLTVADDGRGLDAPRLQQPSDHHGWGLMIMRERAESAGGQLDIESAAGQGTRVIVQVRV